MPKKSRRPDYPGFDRVGKAAPTHGLDGAVGAGNLPFYPNQLLGLAAWFRYGVGITVTGQGVSTWADQSGNGRNLLQGTDGSRPSLQTDNSILFNGTDESLKCIAFTFDQPETVYVLGKQISWTGDDRWFDGEAANSGTLFMVNATPQLGLFAGAQIDNVAPALDTYAVLCCVINGASSVLQLNTNAPVTGNAGANNMSGFTLAARGDLAGQCNIQVKEVILFAAAHDASFRKLVIDYLIRLGL